MKNDVGIDSLKMVKLIMEFEGAFNRKILDEAAEEIKAIADAENYVMAKVETMKAIL